MGYFSQGVSASHELKMMNFLQHFKSSLYLIYFIFWKETTVMRLWGAVNNVATKCSAGWREHGEAGDVVAKCL
jgi:hypothetical protein